ncbi:response regulator [Archangium sp.]|uniref:response regulator n=1 Tax=Archangium sp. TaxID=1872627 RepID=UPI002ED88727
MNEQARKRRILVVDDAEAIHKDFRRILCPEPIGARDALAQLEDALFGPAPSRQTPSTAVFELDSAYQGQEGLARVQEALDAGRPYALAFLDYRMPPGWNGFETLRHLRQVAPSLPVVLCSAYSDYSWQEIAHEFGGPHLLAELRKPFNTQELNRLALTLTGATLPGEGRGATPAPGRG